MKTKHIQAMIKSALLVTIDAQEEPVSVSELDVTVAINQLRHAAEELEAERLEVFHGRKQI